MEDTFQRQEYQLELHKPFMNQSNRELLVGIYMAQRLEIVRTDPTESEPSMAFQILGQRASLRPFAHDFANTDWRPYVETIVILDDLNLLPKTTTASFSITQNPPPLLKAGPAQPGTVESFAGILARQIPQLREISEDDLTRIYDGLHGSSGTDS